jgi:hypothetical protein
MKMNPENVFYLRDVTDYPAFFVSGIDPDTDLKVGYPVRPDTE